MMELDEELTLRIKTVFEDFDDGMQDQGWALLREKYPEKQSRKIPAWWFSGIAACLLLVAGYWIFFNSNTQENSIGKNKPSEKSTDYSAKKTSPTPVNPTYGPQDSILPTQKQNTVKSDRPFQVIRPFKTQIASQANQKPTNSNLGQPKVSSQLQSDSMKALAVIQKQDSSITIKQIGNQEQANVIANVGQAKKTTAEFLAEQSKIAEQQVAKKEKSNHKNSLEVFTGTFLNYAGNDDAKVNAGFGLNANIQIAKKLFLSIGAGISQNKLSYNGNSTGNSDQMNSPNVMMSTDPNYMLSSTYTHIEKSVDAMLLNLDFPITFKFYPTKNQDFYISTGINSSSYLTQQYDYNYKLTNTAINGGRPTFYEETEKRKLQGFSFANSAIFALGINQRLGKSNTLIFEPYFKPALGYMGVNKLKINMIGINLKFNFSNPEKSNH